jgi:hypothetical protein
MSYSKAQFGKDLLEKLDQGYDIVRLSKWALSVYLDKCRDFESGVYDAVMQVNAMEHGPEFEMSEEELRDFAEGLLQDVYEERPPNNAL